MKDKLALIEYLYKDLASNAKVYAEHKETYQKEIPRYHKGELNYTPLDYNYGNRCFGKTALKRKIIYLRQELLNLSNMLED